MKGLNIICFSSVIFSISLALLEFYILTAITASIFLISLISIIWNLTFSYDSEKFNALHLQNREKAKAFLTLTEAANQPTEA